MDLKLAGKKAWIGGSSSGLGLATAKLLAEEGCRVALNGRDRSRLEAAAEEFETDSNHFPVLSPGDVTDPEVTADLIPAAADRLDGLDILITNAGGPPAGKFEDFSNAAWEQAVELSFLSHVRLIKAALPYLRKSAHPSVLTVTSYSVKQPIPNLVLSNSVRAATIGLTKSLALELGEEGIRFNSILPAYTETDRVTSLLEQAAERNQSSLEEEKQRIAASSPFGRMATPEEFARAAVFLVSPAASYLTGVMLPVDGGMYKGTF